MIRKLNLNDIKTLKEILDLQLASYKVEADIIGFYEIPPLKDTIDKLEHCDEVFYGYFIEEVLAGIISYKIEDKILDIHRVAVHPSFFKRGIANQLLCFVEEQKLDIVKIIVSTGKENKPVVSLYMKNGYKKVEDVQIEKDIYLTSFEKDL
jgi:ribosomal protein S18 acetylase RimI-like enzyme